MTSEPKTISQRGSLLHRMARQNRRAAPYDCVNVHIAETENGARSITLDI